MGNRIHPILNSIEFIESHLKDKITVGDIADAAGYSLYYFIRAFNQTVHHTPYDYLMRRRLSAAAVELISSGSRIIDTAFEYQFNNHETFSRAFKRMFSTSPSHWREQGETPYRSIFPPISEAHLEHIQGRNFSKPEIENRKLLNLVGLMVQNKTSHHHQYAHLMDVFENLQNNFELIIQEKPIYYQVYSHKNTNEHVNNLFFGLEMTQPLSVHPPLAMQTIPAGNYLGVCHSGKWETIPLTLDYIYHTWMMKNSITGSNPFEIISASDEDMALANERTNYSIHVPLQIMGA